MKKLDIEQAEPIRKKFAPDWEIRKGTYLYKKVAFDDYNQVLRFLMVIEKPQVKLDHFADIGFFYNEVTMMVYTHDINGLTKLDFELALYINEALEQMGARRLSESVVTEGYKLKLERDTDMMVLNIVDTKTGKRTEVRGKPGYESGNYDPNDKLHILLDRVGKSANISELMNGEVVTINPKHPQGASAKAATDTAFNEALDNPYPFKLSGPTDSQEFSALAKTPNGMLRMDFETTDYDNFGIDFSVGKSMGKTEAGDEFRVFATVVAMMNKWISTVGIEHVESFDFGANKDEHASDGRAKLYTRFAKKLASQLGWKLEQTTTRDGGTAFFRLTNPKPVPREQEYWDAIEENFADGKKKGKSRPGRVKRSGASCNGSVTALRKRAKNSSGEKAKMYHWCANMKSGRKKK